MKAKQKSMPKIFQRTLASTLEKTSKTFPALLITGPRQVGKTTLLKEISSDKRNYVSLDNLQNRELARTDPHLFFQIHKPPVLIDEAQYAPELFTEIKIISDQTRKNGLFWLTGSQKFHLMKNVSESLAGRIAILDLLGFSNAEISDKATNSKPFIPSANWLKNNSKQIPKPKNVSDIYTRIWKGSFPALFKDSKLSHEIFYGSYLQTYLERDVRDILNVSNESSFLRFLQATAARSAQLLNWSDLARDCDISIKTAQSWLSILRTSGLVYLLEPYHTNRSKRLTKTPKLYFLDTGLCAYLTKWPNSTALEAGMLSGAMFESWVFSEILKTYWHNGKKEWFSFYRDKNGAEIDLLIEQNGKLHPIEIKKTANPNISMLRNFAALESSIGKPLGHGALICLVPEATALTAKIDAIPAGCI